MNSIVLNTEQLLDDKIKRAIREILAFIDPDPERDGLKETPNRVLKAYKELFSGYHKKPEDVVTVFEQSYDEMVVSKNIEFTSFCEHHLLPFSGVAHIGYIPGIMSHKVIGLSKLARILDIYAKRLQIQERLTVQVTEALDRLLLPEGSACVIEAKHSCVNCRGVNKQQSTMVTSSLTGAFRHTAVRSEFLNLIHAK